MDCLFSRITNIHPHPNADKLDLGLVNNWPVVVPKGSFIENEIGLFICPDAKLPNNKVWAEPFLNYTGKENRVRTVKLRGEYSNGIFVKLKDLASEYSIHDEDLMLDIKPEQVAIDLGIGHYSPPLPNDLAVAFKCSAQKYDDKWHDVQKRPLDMSKASKKGRLSLILNEINKYQTIQETSERDILDLVFENGKLIREQTFSEIREIVRRNWV